MFYVLLVVIAQMDVLCIFLFACYNAKKQFNDYYYGVHTKDHGKASECIGCGQCEGVCPHNIFNHWIFTRSG